MLSWVSTERGGSWRCGTIQSAAIEVQMNSSLLSRNGYSFRVMCASYLGERSRYISKHQTVASWDILEVKCSPVRPAWHFKLLYLLANSLSVLQYMAGLKVTDQNKCPKPPPPSPSPTSNTIKTFTWPPPSFNGSEATSINRCYVYILYKSKVIEIFLNYCRLHFRQFRRTKRSFRKV